MYQNQQTQDRWTPPQNNWSDVKPAIPGEYEKLPAGAYPCIIKGVEIKYSQNGNEMLMVYFDIAQGQYKDFYAKKYEAVGKKGDWPGLHRQMTGVEGNENSQRFFKGFITSIEESNNSSWEQSGYAFDWFTGKAFAGVFGEEEYADGQGAIKTSCKLQWTRDIHKINTITPPKKKELPKAPAAYSAQQRPYNSYSLPAQQPQQANGGYTQTGFTDITGTVGDDLPF